MVFAIALTPFSAFHNHHQEAPKCATEGKSCSHRFHIHSHAEKCLICTVHLEKTYDKGHLQYLLYQEHNTVLKSYSIVNGDYTKLISLALRGPPVA